MRDKTALESRRVKAVKQICFYVGTYLVSANKAVYKYYIDDDDDDNTVTTGVVSCHWISVDNRGWGECQGLTRGRHPGLI